MALQRNMLKAMGIEDEKIEQIIQSHAETVEGLKAERDQYKADAQKAQDLEKQVKSLQSDLDEVNSRQPDEYESKYKELEKEYKAYQKNVQAEKVEAQKQQKYRQLLEDAGVDSKRIDTVLRVSDLSEVKLNDDGTIKDADELTKQVKDEWKDFIVQEAASGAKVSNPPVQTATPENDLENMTVEQYADFYQQRRKA